MVFSFSAIQAHLEALRWPVRAKLAVISVERDSCFRSTLDQSVIVSLHLKSSHYIVIYKKSLYKRWDLRVKISLTDGNDVPRTCGILILIGCDIPRGRQLRGERGI